MKSIFLTKTSFKNELLGVINSRSIEKNFDC